MSDPPDDLTALGTSGWPWGVGAVDRRFDEERIVEWDEEAHAEWVEKWAPRCPEGYPQRLREAVGFRERSICELELRVPLTNHEHGACQVVVDEQEDEVHVRVLVCYDDGREDDKPLGSREFVVCPVRVWLEQPLGDRAVIDVDSDEELDLYTPAYLDNVAQPDAGYRPANRRPSNVVKRLSPGDSRDA
jgi:hypothetical protein